MARALPSERFQLEFLTNVQRLLSEGDFVASYKFALLHALADLSVEQGADTAASLILTTDQIAEKYVQYYWRQTAPYSGRKETKAQVLLQNTDRQAAVINTVCDLRRRFDGRLSIAKRDEKIWRPLIREIRTIVERMPLWKLQTVGDMRLNFLYENAFLEPHAIQLKPGIAFCFRRFYGLIVDLVQSSWVRWLRRVKANQDVLGQVTDLSEFLFGADRANLSLVQEILFEFQKGECFYCGKGLEARGAVDHFIPWSRYSMDLGHNFVLAHDRCNAAKSDHLADGEHLGRWWERNERFGNRLGVAFDSKRVAHSIEATKTVARWAYLQATQARAMAWIRGKDMRPLNAGLIARYDAS